MVLKDDNGDFLRNVNEEEQVALWREGRRREPMPVEIDFWLLSLVDKIIFFA